MTTFNSYGPVAPHRQAEILNALVLEKPGQAACNALEVAPALISDRDAIPAGHW
jgi:hypothetical protein